MRINRFTQLAATTVHCLLIILGIHGAILVVTTRVPNYAIHFRTEASNCLLALYRNTRGSRHKELSNRQARFLGVSRTYRGRFHPRRP
jgi:hypothetical protein